MGKSRKCILCETVHVSKQEMDEHLRSMLHHRELEKLKGRDCGHECRVCKVTVASLTDYASHISSSLHKQNVEAEELKNARKGHDEFYFDKELVDLIKKRKDRIRKEEVAAAKRAKEEEQQRKQQEFQQRLQEAKGRLRLDYALQQSLRDFGGSLRQKAWNGRNKDVVEARPWKQGKSATWHAQEPPNFQKWESGALGGGSFHSQESFGKAQWNHRNQIGRHTWFSNDGGSNGFFEQNPIPQYSQTGQPSFGSSARHQPPPGVSGLAAGKFQSPNQSNSERQQGSNGHQSGQARNAEYDLSSPKSFGSNQKLDKTCRWSPYPVSKVIDSAPNKDTPHSSTEKHPKDSTHHKKVKSADKTSSNRRSRPEQQAPPVTSNGQNVKETKKPSTKTKGERSGSGSRSSSAQRDGPHTSAQDTSSQKPKKDKLLQKDKKLSSAAVVRLEPRPKKSSSQEQEQPKSTSKLSGLSSESSSIGPLQSRQAQQFPEIPKKPKRMLEKGAASSDRPSCYNRVQTALLHIAEGKQKEHAENPVGVNKENSCRQNAAKSASLESLTKPEVASLDSSQFLQSVHVSTSTVENSEPASSARKDQEEGRAEKETHPGAPDEAMQVVEAGQGSESDASRSGGEASTTSGSTASGLSKLDLPPALKRDLTKHISSKSKPGTREPNLNSARRVRNLSESRRGESEKESGIKPTVRQLISSSGSRRNVNWDQVYQEVRKKQEQGKGMPRFGIEMVPYDQEEHSQEDEDNIPLLEGFHWESLTDIPDSGPSRKRSLSESSVAPDRSSSAHSLFPPHISKETAHRVGLSPPRTLNTDPQGPSYSLNHRTGDNQQRQEVEPLGQCETKTQKQPDKTVLGTAKAPQPSESAIGDSSSGTELYDGQGTGKKRRAAGDAPNPEGACLERKSKRRKIKSKKERSQIDQLLAVSLREEELSRSLTTVDDSLNQARAALQAAYMEVQRLMVVKQQMATEMSTLRNQRIDLLKGMKDGSEDAPHLSMKEEKMDSHAVSTVPPTAPPTAPSIAPSTAASHADPSASPPSSSLLSMPVVIKQEPQSPVYVGNVSDPVEDTIHCAHSTTPEQSVADPASNRQPCETSKEQIWESIGAPAECKESSSGVVQATEKAMQATGDALTHSSDSKVSSRRSSAVGSLANYTASQSFEPPSVPSEFALPASPPELRNGKRVRKLKKRRVLKKAQGTEQPESSDTELDGEASKPRWTRARRRPSEGSQISTSTLPTAVEDEERDTVLEKERQGSEEASGPLNRAIKLEEEDSAVTTELMKFDTTEPEESMEVSAYTDRHVQVPGPCESEPQTLACNEVTSTSDMDICMSPPVKTYESDPQMSLTLPKTSKTSSDASSDPGEEEIPTEGAFEGHQEAVNAMQIHNGLLYTCSGDRTVRAFDLASHQCVSVFEGHSSKVNCLLVSAAPTLHHRLYSGSSDQTIRCYSLKTQEFEQQFSLSDRVLCLHSRWKVLFAGLANGAVVTFNLKTNKQTDVLECHGPRGVSCLATSQEGARKILLVGSYDSTISVRDAKNGLLLRTLEGHTKTVLCMKVINDLVFSGSSDQSVHAHNIHTGELLRVYKGHTHGVTVVAVLGKVMVTACLDKLVRVYDLQSQERMQIYGGHKDMVMCMAVHKNMIYTGCYDGSVQAVKLNLMQNHRCLWHGCSLVFGLTEHLQQHLINDHTSPNLQTLKCRWKNCDEFFCARNSSKQGMLRHMQKHAEETAVLEP
ncbi:zinc finger protein 106 [Genypterus blacodes]|uniref:zinc finger protein 106 n=1 Tax=Genypterus blacodes TaxID=154954 RepID=UPI003F76EB1E